MTSRTKSIGFRFVAMMVLGMTIMVAVLFAAFIKNERDATIMAEVHAARNLVLMAESVRENMEVKWELGMFSPQALRTMEYTDEKDRRTKLLAAVPVAAAWNAAKAKAKEGGFEFRTPRHGARNKANEPDAIEQEVLTLLKNNPQIQEHHIVDKEKNVIRYFRPVRLSKTCLNCHGNPANSFELWRRDDGRDITGYKMDGKKVGDMHGAFEIIRPLGQADAALNLALLKATGIVVPLMLLGIALTWYMTRCMVTKPLEKAVDVCDAMSKGDLSHEINVKSENEVGQLMRSLKEMSENLYSIVKEVKVTSDSVASGSEQLAAGNIHLSQRTEEQATALEESATSMEEMTSTVKINADFAQEANELANAARRRALTGSEVVQQTVNAMGEINQSSTRISDIITTIDGIAFQTNLLALNAAVEAARAGEQGRGFAVVAGEVRSLAQRSADAAKEIKTLIEDSVEKVRNGTEFVDQSGKTLEEIMEGIQKVADIIGEITASSKAQSAGIDQVNSAIMNMDDMTQENAALVEQAAAAARSMQDQAGELSKLMNFFRFSEGVETQDFSSSSRKKQAAVTTLPATQVGHSGDSSDGFVVVKSTVEQKQSQGKTGTNNQEWEDF